MNDEEEYFTCPECGYPLSTCFSKDRKGKFAIEFFCEGPGEDEFSFQIATSLADEDIAGLKKGKTITKEMAIKVLVRKSEE